MSGGCGHIELPPHSDPAALGLQLLLTLPQDPAALGLQLLLEPPQDSWDPFLRQGSPAISVWSSASESKGGFAFPSGLLEKAISVMNVESLLVHQDSSSP